MSVTDKYAMVAHGWHSVAFSFINSKENTVYLST